MQRGTGRLAVAVEPSRRGFRLTHRPILQKCRLVIVPSYGGVADNWLEFLESFPPPRADQEIACLQSETTRYTNCPPQSQADRSLESMTASCTRCAPVTSGKSISGLSIRP